MIYTGVGSRKAPPDILRLMQELGRIFGRAGWTLRSGGAGGADEAFEEGADDVGGLKEIYEPWPGFSTRTGAMSTRVNKEALSMAATVHPAWAMLSQAAQKLHARNCFQLLGASLTVPSNIAVCWTPDGIEMASQRTRSSGGTATAVVLAERAKVPVYNLKNQSSCNKLAVFLQSKGLPVPEQLTALLQGSLF
ncbi:MAG: hypothetical protein Q7U16_01385 [Agitococcus sp.]|nr:hypothetical protein [Agitococcus sp.]